jgi:hypothetical protein
VSFFCSTDCRGANPFPSIDRRRYSGSMEAAQIEAVEECLRGTSNRVDLWQLRELALSPGGLVNAELRQRAWPLLTQALTPAGTTTVHPLAPLDVWRIQRDVKHSLWNIQRAAASITIASSPMRPRKPRRVQFAVDFLDQEKDEVETRSPEDTKEASSTIIRPLDDGKENDDPGGSLDPSSRKIPRRRRSASAAEQRMVANVLTSCLQRAPIPGEDPYSYYTGFHDVTTLVLRNLQSLSLTSLLLYVRRRDMIRCSALSLYIPKHI